MSTLIWKRILSELVDKFPGGWFIARRSRRKYNRPLLLEPLETRQLLAADFLYIADAVTDSVQKFNADTGAYLGSFVASGSAGLHGPRGMVFDQGKLLVVNQNINLPKNGEVLRYNGQTGADAGAIVPASNIQAPFSPAGMVVHDQVAYVADPAEGSFSGRIEKYDSTTGDFLGELVPTNFNGEFRPRGLVFGPDGELYVTVSSIAETGSSDPPGYILSFDIATGIDRVVAWNDGDQVSEAGEATNLHNPTGLVFAPDGTIYVTSNRTDTSTSIDENTRLVIINPAQGNELKTIELDPHTDPAKNPTRLFAQAMVFGPEGKLFIPVVVESLGDGPFFSTIVTTVSGAIVTYDPSTQQINTFFASSPFEPSISAPTYLTFTQTNPATLAYQPWHNFVNRLDVDGDGHVAPLDVLIVINEVNTPTVTGSLGKLPSSRPSGKFYFDVDQDGFVAPIDALIVINFLTDHPQSEGESALPTLRNPAPVVQSPVPPFLASATASSSPRQALSNFPAPYGSTSVATADPAVAAKTNAEPPPRKVKTVKLAPLESDVLRDFTFSRK